MSDSSPRLRLPFLFPGQAQKELFHNEALALLDVVTQPSVVAAGLATPPDAPGIGACWIVGAAPTGAWSGQAGAIAGWTEGGWRFVVPGEGFAVWDQANSRVLRWLGGAWMVGPVAADRLVIGGVRVVGAQGAAITDPAGGSVVDAEARAALGAVLSALRAHGLVAP